MTHVLDDLHWRGLVALATDLDALQAELVVDGQLLVIDGPELS